MTVLGWIGCDGLAVYVRITFSSVSQYPCQLKIYDETQEINVCGVICVGRSCGCRDHGELDHTRLELCVIELDLSNLI